MNERTNRRFAFMLMDSKQNNKLMMIIADGEGDDDGDDHLQ